jgi:hypothetical protein
LPSEPHHRCGSFGAFLCHPLGVRDLLAQSSAQLSEGCQFPLQFGHFDLDGLVNFA